MNAARKQNHWLSKQRGPAFDIPPALTAAIADAKAGRLDEAQLSAFGCYPSGTDWYKQQDSLDSIIARYGCRDTFIYNVGFLVPSRQWLDALASFLHANGLTRVLEVCAGHGTLVRPMTERGIKWTATDEAPMGPDVQEGDALAVAEVAVHTREVDALFASWLPMHEDTDRKLASFGVPFIMFGEPPGGCTGSNDFENSNVYRVEYACDVVPGWRDSPQWYGIHDMTMIATPLTRPAFGKEEK